MNSIGKLARFTLHKALSPVLKDGAQRNLAVSSAMTGAKGVGLYWGLLIVGLDPSPLLAVFGMFGAAVGFAGKDLVSNFISGATLAASNTFSKGDTISVGSSGSGVLIDMDMKYLYLEQADGTLLLIPNSSVTTSVVSIAGAAKRKRLETASFDDAKFDKVGLSEDAQTRRGRRLLYALFVGVPFLCVCTVIGFAACGLMTVEEARSIIWRSESDEAKTKRLTSGELIARLQSSVRGVSDRAAQFIPSAPPADASPSKK